MGEPSRSLPNPSEPAALQGDLGRTRHRNVTVTSANGDTFRATILELLNVTESPHIKAAFMAGQATDVVDPHSRQRYTLALPVIYHDERLRLFALVLPDSLRHAELDERARLLTRFSEAGVALPRYVREFKTVFGPQGIAALEAQLSTRDDEAGAQALLQQRLEVEEQARTLISERHGLEALRLNLEGLKNKLQDQEEVLRSGQVPAIPRKQDEAPTTVVPREVFYGPSSTDDEDESRPWGAGMALGWEIEADDQAAAGPPSAPPPAPISAPSLPAVPAPTQPWTRGGAPTARTSSAELPVTNDIPRTFNRLKAGSRAFYHTLSDDGLLLSYRLPEERMMRFDRSAPRLFLQLHDLEEFPLTTLLLAAIDEDDNLIDDLYWPLDLRKVTARKILDALAQRFELRAALYGEDLKLRQILEFKEPLELNAQHLTRLTEQRLSQTQGLSFDDALRRIEAPGYERLGSMRHNFHRDSFQDLDSPSKVKLAAGIVGYWSGPETFRYLIENRSFSLEWFAAIQERVVRGAFEFGVALSEELRQLAIDELRLAPDEHHLLKALAATWAQVELGLGHKNDLDPLETWENWQELIEGLEALGFGLEDGLAEVARAALRRAQGYAEENDLLSAFPEADLDNVDPPTIDRSDLLNDLSPNPNPRDTNLEDLSEVEEDELKAMLVDEDKRLAAAARLLSHGEPEAVMDVLMSAERMNEAELEALSEQLALHAPRLEDALIDCLGLGSPTIAYLCSFSLASIPSAKALPTLLAAAVDTNRAPEPELFCETLMPYGNSLLDAAIPALKNADNLHGGHPLIILARNLDRVLDGAALKRLKIDLPDAAALL